MWELLDKRHVHTGSVKCYAGELDKATTKQNHRSLMERDKPTSFSPCGHQHRATVVIGGNIVFIHESNKAESVLKAFTARIGAHE